MKQFNVAHISDVHLGWDSGAALAARGFRVAIDKALDSDAALILIAGDLFDHSQVGQDALDVAVEGFTRFARPVVVLPGNHDCYDESSIYHRFDIELACPNVTLLKRPEGETVRFPRLGLSVWGRPVVSHEPAFQPMAGLPARNGDPFYVGMAHGLFLEDDQPSYRSSPIRAEELARSGCDYIALGHWHHHEDLSRYGALAAYSGSPMGTGFSDKLGQLLLITFGEGTRPVLRQVPLDG